MNSDMKLYYDYTISPLGRLFYKSITSQLSNIKNKTVFDFGSGFGFTANYLAKNNEVTALEQDKSMIEASERSNNYTQIHGDLTALTTIPSESFDVVLCHLVLEFVDNPKQILNELSRILKKGGLLSVVRHNKNGRLIQAIVQDYDLEDANTLLDGGFSYSSAFGDIKYYSNEDLFKQLPEPMQLIKISGARVLASLHNASVQNQEHWVEKMFAIEERLLDDPDFLKIAYFNHIFLQK